MKKLLLIYIALLISSCSSMQEVQPQEEFYNIYGYDFTKYTERGFLITPEEYWDTYESMGIIRIQYAPQFTRTYPGSVGWDQEYTDSKVYKNPYVSDEYWRVSKPNTDTIIEEAYNIANQLGADAITAFDINLDVYKNGPIEVDTYTVTGFAIKRLK